MPYPSSFTKLNPNNQAVNSDKGILLPRKIYLQFAADAKLSDALKELQFINSQNLILWAYSRANKVISEKTSQAFLQSQVEAGLLLELNDKDNGQHFIRTKQWKDANKIPAVKLEATARIEELKQQGYK